MKTLRNILICFLTLLLITNITAPATVSAASRYGVLLGNAEGNYRLYDNLTVLSPTGNLMVKAYPLTKALGLSYSYNSTTKKLTIKNITTGKRLVYVLNSSNYTYYKSKTAAGVTKTASYKFYYDSASDSNLVHAATLKYLLQYNYYKDLSSTYYGKLGYTRLLAYSMTGYSSYDIPITQEVIDYINAKTYTSKEELLEAVRMNMIARNSSVTFKTTQNLKDEIGSKISIFDMVLALDNTNTSKDGDYLSLLVDSLYQNWKWKTRTTTYKGITEVKEFDHTLTVQIQYETTLAQEGVVDSKVTSILKKLNLTNATDYEKVKAIHDYIIKLASYDSSYQKSSAYDILINKTSVCEGYALSAYRLFTDAGLESRIVTGLGDGENHAWNIVKVNGAWYNIDLTWDDPITSSGAQIIDYDYFLKNDQDFIKHIRNEEFKTQEFLTAYPIAEDSYQ